FHVTGVQTCALPISQNLTEKLGHRKGFYHTSFTKHRCVLPFFHAGSTLRLNKFLTSELKNRWEMLSPSPVKFAHPLNLEYISLAGRPIESSTSRPSSLIQRRTGVSSLKYSSKSSSTALGLVKPFWYTRRRYPLSAILSR